MCLSARGTIPGAGAERRIGSFRASGGIQPGITFSQAQADLDRVMRNLADAYPETNRGNGASLIPLEDRLVRDVKPILWMLLGAVGFVLLIACVNVSNLLRAFDRQSARIRRSRRARRGTFPPAAPDVDRKHLLALIGGALGLLLAAWGTRAALAVLPSALPRMDEIGMDYRVLSSRSPFHYRPQCFQHWFPTLRALREQVPGTQKRRTGRERCAPPGDSVLVTVEVALALVLLIGAGLMIRSMSALWSVDLGFSPDNVVTFEIAFPPSMRSDSVETRTAKIRELSEMLRSSPGVRAFHLPWVQSLCRVQTASCSGLMATLVPRTQTRCGPR